MKILNDNYKRNMTVNLSAAIIIIPGVMVLKQEYALALLFLCLQGVVLFMTNLFVWQRENIRWYIYYVYGMQVLFCTASWLVHSEWLGFFSGWAPLMVLVYCIEFYLAVEKTS